MNIIKIKVTAPYFRYKSRMYVTGRIIDIEPDAFDATFVVKVEESKPVVTAIVIDEPIVEFAEPTVKRHRSKVHDY